MANTEFGIFNDEGCVERGLWSAAQAAEVLSTYDPEDEVTAHALCGEHEEQAADHCEDCNAEPDEDDDAEDDDA